MDQNVFGEGNAFFRKMTPHAAPNISLSKQHKIFSLRNILIIFFHPHCKVAFLFQFS
jgi:hypothetical protein